MRRYSQGGGDYDPNTSTGAPVGTSGTYDETRKALIADQPGSQISIHFGQTLQNGTLIQRGDKWLYLSAADGSMPTLQDHVIIGTLDYSIVDVQVTNPGGIDLLYLIVLRR